MIGLSSSAVTSWAANAHLPSLLTGQAKKLFRIVALCNSSTEAAKSAIKAYDLDDSVRAYGYPEALAADENVDFVICNTRVDKHYETILPSLRAGKSAYIEWPIAQDLNYVEELVTAAREGNARVAVGLQGRFAPPVARLRELLQSGNLGKLLCTEARVFGGTKDREILPVGLKYFAESKIGGNPITIGFGHGELQLA